MEVYLGTICIFGFNFAPYQWQMCQGQILAISSNTALFSLLGTYYGGNGTSTFALPNLQGRRSNHQGTLTGGSLYTLGQFAGTTTVSILSGNMPTHAHSLTVALKVNNVSSGAPSATGNYNGTTNDKPYNNTTTGAMAAFSITLGANGGSQPITIADPTLVMNYCIAMQGIFPTRN